MSADALRQVFEQNRTGIFHAAGSEYISRFDFTIKLAQVFGFDSSLVNRIKTAELNQKAPRPMNSRFTMKKLETETGVKMRDVESGLRLLKTQLER